MRSSRPQQISAARAVARRVATGVGSLVVVTALTVPVAGPAQATGKPRPFSDLYVASYNGECTHVLSVIKNPRVTRTWEPVGGACNAASAMAVVRTVRTLGARPEFVGAEYTLRGRPTGVTYAYPTTVTMDLPDGTTDGRANYAGGYFDGVVYRFSRDWTDPVPLFSTGLFLGGIAYDPHTRSLWVLDSRTDFEAGTGEIRNYAMDGTLRSSFVVRGGSDPQPFALAYDAADRTLWISRNRGFDTPALLEQYSTHGRYLGSTTTSLTGIVGGLEFALRHPCRHHHHSR
ncbi:MAG TPA: hypothetical protein PLP61_12785 [Nocardioides sp.]|uniref:hypothetical protein n=1 Tax=Nocardioides sp. TaxID=35761 RepID=UPI002BE2FCAE|nr:hypothetical protein [Nocardioides sp.]HQR27907.1 hypothetical protein [Nocardioides sp.]